MINYYRTVIESILTTNILDWFGCTNKRKINKIESIIIKAESIIGSSLCTIQSNYQERTIERTSNIIKALSHPVTRYFYYLSNDRLCAFKCNKRYIDSFHPLAIQTLNTNFYTLINNLFLLSLIMCLMLLLQLVHHVYLFVFFGI